MASPSNKAELRKLWESGGDILHEVHDDSHLNLTLVKLRLTGNDFYRVYRYSSLGDDPDSWKISVEIETNNERKAWSKLCEVIASELKFELSLALTGQPR